MPLAPHPRWLRDESVENGLFRHGVSRRDFLEYCGSLCTVLGVGNKAETMVQALTAPQRPPAIWLQLQECTGCVESVLRTAEPTIGDLVLDMISLDYQHTLMEGRGTRWRRPRPPR